MNRKRTSIIPAFILSSSAFQSVVMVYAKKLVKGTAWTGFMGLPH